jgi:hypothetical protein
MAMSARDVSFFNFIVSLDFNGSRDAGMFLVEALYGSFSNMKTPLTHK